MIIKTDTNIISENVTILISYVDAPNGPARYVHVRRNFANAETFDEAAKEWDVEPKPESVHRTEALELYQASWGASGSLRPLTLEEAILSGIRFDGVLDPDDDTVSPLSREGHYMAVTPLKNAVTLNALHQAGVPTWNDVVDDNIMVALRPLPVNHVYVLPIVPSDWDWGKAKAAREEVCELMREAGFPEAYVDSPKYRELRPYWRKWLHDIGENALADVGEGPTRELKIGCTRVKARRWSPPEKVAKSLIANYAFDYKRISYVVEEVNGRKIYLAFSDSKGGKRRFYIAERAQ